jgi:membrane protein YqaA with SNARE-associated domain
VVRRLYNWVLSWAHTPYAVPALFLLAFSESSFFPIPPDVLIIALAISLPKRGFYYALVSSVGSVLGGAFGYLIGLYFMEAVGYNIISFYGLTDSFLHIQQLYRQYDAIAVGIAGFTPIPYKVFTIAAGAFEINFWVFVLASLVSRSLRFFLLGGIIYFYGEGIRDFIDRYFNILTIIFAVFLVLGFVLIGLFLG